MSVVYDLGNANAWSLIFSTTKIAPPAPSQKLNSYYPIPDFEASVQPSSPVLAIYATSESAEERWRTGGFIKQRIRTGLLGGGNPDAYVQAKKFYLNQFTIIEFQRLSTAYSIEFSIPYWLREITFDVYEYTGLIDNVIEQQIQDLEQKLIECCDELKTAILNQEDINEIVAKLNEIQNKLNECCDGSNTLGNQQLAEKTSTLNLINFL